MNELLKNAANIIKAASSDTYSMIAFVILVFSTLFYLYLAKIKEDKNSLVLLFMFSMLAFFIVLILRPICPNGSYSNPCPPPELCWDGSRTNPCPKKPWKSVKDIGKDKNKQTATFNMYVMTNEYSWEIGTPSSNAKGKIKYNNELKDPEFIKIILQVDDLRKVLNSADYIISFGTASCQGDNDEDKRAFDRANAIQLAIKEIYKGRAISPIYKKVNLGQFRTPEYSKCGDASSTAYQRSIIVVGADIDKNNNEVVIGEALENFLKTIEIKEGKIGSFKISDYSKFDYTF
jgi:hypothetical protein